MLGSIWSRFRSKENDAKIKSYKGLQQGLTEVHAFHKRLQLNLDTLEEIFDRCSDVKYRNFEIGTTPPVAACCIYVDAMVDKKIINEHILENLMALNKKQTLAPKDLEFYIQNALLSSIEVEKIDNLVEAADLILSGDAALLIDGCATCFVIGAKGFQIRGIEESASEQVIRGPRDGFVENIQLNTSLIRRRLQSSRLKFEQFKTGAISKTSIEVAYIDGIVEPGVVAEVKKRLTRIDIDAVLESNYLEEFMVDQPWSPFPQVNATERPDKVVGGLLSGQVAVLVDNTPFVLLMPVTFPQFLQATEDYYDGHYFATFNRFLRFVALNIALLLPSLYIAIVTFHQEMLPTPLLLSLASGRENTPFPAFVEALLMETTFEILREAGVRLPRAIGQATSIVGALVIGQAAVNAGLVSPAMVIVVALTALASFLIPTPSGGFTVRMLRFPIMFMAATLGLFGIMAALMAILIHLSALRSFGVPYLSPLAPLDTSALKDAFVRVPWWMTISRPKFISRQEPQRQDKGQKPGLTRKQKK